jgi:hypothetical protein
MLNIRVDQSVYTLSYLLDDPGIMAERFSFHHCVQFTSGAHPQSNLMSAGGSVHGGKGVAKRLRMLNSSYFLIMC